MGECFVVNGNFYWYEVWQSILRDTDHQALQKLLREQRLIVELTYFYGWTQTRIAPTYQLPLGTVKARLRLALRHLKHALLQMGITEF